LRLRSIPAFTPGITLFAFGYVSFYAGFVKTNQIELAPYLFGSDTLATAIAMIAMAVNGVKIPAHSKVYVQRKHPGSISLLLLIR